MIGDLVPLRRVRGVAMHAVLVGERVTKHNFFCSFFGGHGSKLCVVEPHVAHAANLCERGSVHAVVGVALITVFISKSGVARVGGCESPSFGIVGGARVGLHDVARATKGPFLGGLVALNVRRERGGDRENAESQEQPSLHHVGDRGAHDEESDQNGGSERRTGDSGDRVGRMAG